MFMCSRFNKVVLPKRLNVILYLIIVLQRGKKFVDFLLRSYNPT